MAHHRRRGRAASGTVTALVLGAAAALVAVGMIVVAVLTIGHTRAESAHPDAAVTAE